MAGRITRQDATYGCHTKPNNGPDSNPYIIDAVTRSWRPVSSGCRREKSGAGPARPMRKVQSDSEFDLVLVGGGLQNVLIALARADANPTARIALVERESRLGGNHTWCFHASDVVPEAGAFVDALIEHRWSGYDIAFPGYTRQMRSRYAGFSSAHLDRVANERLGHRAGCAIVLGAEATDVTAERVRLSDGRTLAGRLVVDARGPGRPPQCTAGYQKFIGQELLTARPHGLVRPIVMDARVPQRDGFRFFYVLPLALDRLLVEDTYFSDRPDLDRETIRREIAAYSKHRGFDVSTVLREEEGVLPMPWAGDGPSTALAPLVAGYRGGWAHPATGYSLPIAAHLAVLVGRLTGGEQAEAVLAGLASRLGPQMRFARLLNRLLFRWYLPDQRRHVFERFYRLPEPTIRRFYALHMTVFDRARILVGRPPRGFSLRARLTAVERLNAVPRR
jgi:lycopene beta-cyclase